VRPYHVGYSAESECFTWNYGFKAEPGELYLTAEQKKVGDVGAVIIEPNTKQMPLSRNKAWPMDRWQKVVDALDLPWVQLGPRDIPSLLRVRRVVTPTFTHALGWLYNCALIVTTDGALHHAAAALGKPAVVLWGGLVPPRILGYDTHTNICHAKTWCGSNFDCKHCREAMSLITVEEVCEAIKHHRAVPPVA